MNPRRFTTLTEAALIGTKTRTEVFEEPCCPHCSYVFPEKGGPWPKDRTQLEADIPFHEIIWTCPKCHGEMQYPKREQSMFFESAHSQDRLLRLYAQRGDHTKLRAALAAFGLGPDYVPPARKMHECPQCHAVAAIIREAHADTGMDEMELRCTACGTSSPLNESVRLSWQELDALSARHQHCFSSVCESCGAETTCRCTAPKKQVMVDKCWKCRSK